MSAERERFEAELSDCGCCEGLAAASPVQVHNRPGLDALAYRVGTHASFKESLLAAFSSSRRPELADFTTRDDDDFSIALADAFSSMADVLSFYQERLANEAFLRTATERRSLRDLARLIGYQLAPGVAAEAYLAFTLEEAPGVPADEVGKTIVAVGTRVQSTPGPDEAAQIFETVEEIEGRVAWNAIRPPLSSRHLLPTAANPLYFQGLATQLKPGDAVLYGPDGGDTAFGVVADVTPVPEFGLTEVRLSYLTTVSVRGSMPAVEEPDPILGSPASTYMGQTLSAADLEAEAEVQEFDADDLLRQFSDNPKPAPRVLVLRSRAAVFGHNASSWKALPLPLKVQQFGYKIKADGTYAVDGGPIAAPFANESAWVDAKEVDHFGSTKVFLDASYPGISSGGTVVLRSGTTWGVYTVDAVAEESHTDFNLSAKVTRLTLDGSSDQFSEFPIRSTSVYGESEVLELARPPITSRFEADASGWLELGGWVPGLEVGQRVIVTGRSVGGSDEPVSEAAELTAVEHRLRFEGCTLIALSPALANNYVRGDVTINANVAAATHGESVEEILGSGDASQAFQSFVLAQPPLTFASASTPSGRESTLEVRVNDILWHEEETLYGSAPGDRIFTSRQDDEGRTIVQFGDGRTGARLPSGTNNVRAGYRKGIGLGGQLSERQLDVLLSRPLGLKGVVNPLAAEGGEDPETRDQARRNAPTTVLTLGRAVSLRDYEDFARTFAGIDKALATWTWDGRRRRVFVTIAGSGGKSVPDGGFLSSTLLEALVEVGDPNVPLRIASYRKAVFRLGADVIVQPDYLEDHVLAAVEEALRDRFSFDARDFGQPVALSEVVSTIQNVEGVVAVDLNHLYRSENSPELEALLPSDRPLEGALGEVDAAEILFLDPAPLDELSAAS